MSQRGLLTLLFIQTSNGANQYAEHCAGSVCLCFCAENLMPVNKFAHIFLEQIYILPPEHVRAVSHHFFNLTHNLPLT